MGKLKNLAGETVLYGLGSMLPRFLNFLLIRLHTDVFYPAEYGVIGQLFAYVAVINIVFLFGMETAYFRFASKPGADERKVFNATQTIVVIISLVCSIGLVVFSTPFASMLLVPGQEKLVMYVIGIMFIDAVVAIPFSRLRLQKKPLLFAAGKVFNIIILLGLNLIFLKSGLFEPHVSYVVIANLVANSFYLLLFARTLLSWRPVFVKNISSEMITYGYPIMLSGLAGMTNEMFSRIMLDNWLPNNFYQGLSSKEALGVFSACYKYAVFMNLAIMAFRYAAEPFFFSQSNEKNSPQLFARVNHYFVIACCIFLLGVSINLDILRVFLAKEIYWSGLGIVPILLLAYLFLGIYYNISVWYKLTDRTYYGTLITVLGVVITFAGNYFLIPVMGYMGSSVAALVCYFVMMLVSYFAGQHFYPIPYNLIKSFSYVLITTSLVYIVYAVDKQLPENDLVRFIFHSIVIVVYGAVVFLVERKDLLKQA